MFSFLLLRFWLRTIQWREPWCTKDGKYVAWIFSIFKSHYVGSHLLTLTSLGQWGFLNTVIQASTKSLWVGLRKKPVQFSRSVVSNSLSPRESQHARPPCPSPTPRVHSDSHPSSRWCHPAISSSVVPFSSCPQSSQHQSLFQWVNSLREVAKVLEFQL